MNSAEAMQGIVQDELTRLAYAVAQKQPDWVAVIIESGADLNAACLGGKTALFFAVGQPALATSLLEAGAISNAADGDGQTFLHACAAGNDAAGVKLALEFKAEIDAKDGKGQTPLIIAVGVHARDAAVALIGGGADVLAADADGWAALHFAVGDSDADRGAASEGRGCHRCAEGRAEAAAHSGPGEGRWNRRSADEGRAEVNPRGSGEGPFLMALLVDDVAALLIEVWAEVEPRMLIKCIKRAMLHPRLAGRK
jgi:hypothetical protein